MRDALRVFIEAAGRPVEVTAAHERFLNLVASVGTAASSSIAGCLTWTGSNYSTSYGEGHQLPAIMITGYGDIPLAIRAMRAGAASFLQKPVQADELLAAIEHALEQAKAHRARRPERGDDHAHRHPHTARTAGAGSDRPGYAEQTNGSCA